MTKLTNWIEGNQLKIFFILTFSITWGLGFSFSGVYRGQFILLPLTAIALCGPALAGIIITTITNTKPKQGTNKVFWSAFIIAWMVCAVVFLTHTRLFYKNLFPTGLVLVTVIPVAFVISMAYSRIPNVKSYLVPLIRVRSVWKWIIVAMVLIGGLAPLSFVIGNLLDIQSVSDISLPGSGLTLIGLIAVRFIDQFFFFNATGEEVGWRGFALPRLQARTSPLVAAFIIALFWAPWHFFLWHAEGAPVLTWLYWLVKYLGTIIASVFIVWFYNRTQGSILVAGIAHAAWNTGAAFIPIKDGLILYPTSFIIVLIMVLVDRMWKKLPSECPTVYRSPLSTA
jgi:membrane protease YdiL (CAAX protease family)